MAFINSLDQDSNVYADFESFMNSKKKEELDVIISEEGLNKEETYKFIENSFDQGIESLRFYDEEFEEFKIEKVYSSEVY